MYIEGRGTAAGTAAPPAAVFKANPVSRTVVEAVEDAVIDGYTELIYC